jgi:hypothetical protein
MHTLNPEYSATLFRETINSYYYIRLLELGHAANVNMKLIDFLTSWKSPAEERTVGDGVFCFLGRWHRQRLTLIRATIISNLPR